MGLFVGSLTFKIKLVSFAKFTKSNSTNLTQRMSNNILNFLVVANARCSEVKFGKALVILKGALYRGLAVLIKYGGLHLIKPYVLKSLKETLFPLHWGVRHS